jgi:dTDP-4-amino-4,6-dideoxygalactose transaminase
MTLGALRPVGEYVRLFPEHREFRWPERYEVAWLDSGTSALAIAVKTACALSPQPQPRVVIPAYTCPDVVSAVVWAGALPLLVDTRAGTPWIDEKKVSACLYDRVVAVVAPHFLGIPHPLNLLSAMCREAGVTLIEDSAQLGPISPAFRPSADLVVLSFGRGKPVPAGGGALLHREGMRNSVTSLLSTLPKAEGTAFGWRMRIALQNIGMSRLGFSMARRMPGLHVGETRYRVLSAPARISDKWGALASATLAGWTRSSRSADVAREVEERLGSQPGLKALSGPLGWDRNSSLLRLPMLAGDRADRDAFVNALVAMGIGASKLYGSALRDIPNMPQMEMTSDLSNAILFGDCLVTLPCHSGVTELDLRTIDAAVRPLSRARARSLVT